MPEYKIKLMAGNIFENLAAYPEAIQKRRFVEHLRQFWTPSMRAELLECYTTQPQHFTRSMAAAMEALRETTEG